MLRKQKILILASVLYLTGSAISCIEPVVPDLNEDDMIPVLVVEGKITDKPGPFRVRLSRSVRVNVMYYDDPVTDAEVWIHDDTGASVQLYSIGNGWYESSEKILAGETGVRYTLEILEADGTQYQSESVLMESSTGIDSLFFKEENTLNTTDDQLSILLDSHDSENRIKYWYFEFDETWEVRMLTDGVPVEHSSPGSPSHITRENVRVSEDQIVCWVTKHSSSVLIASTASSPVNELKNFVVNTLGPGEDKLHIRYSILVSQSAISRELYEYWRLLKDVNENTGGLYETMPAQVYGNISCCNGNKKALGFFSALAVSEKRLFIDRSDHSVLTRSAYEGCMYYDYEQLPWVPKSFFGRNTESGIDIFCSADYCADCKAYGTNVKPDFWE
jgi:hypothetical protein